MKTTASAGIDRSPPDIRTVRCVFIAGFVGAGKTTAAAQLAGYLDKKGVRVGLIANDHGNELVDTSFFRANNYPTDEIRGGCFSSQVDTFIEMANAFVERNSLNVLIAEPTGNCHNLADSVAHSVRDRFLLAPISVVLDPIQAGGMFGMNGGPRFSQQLAYLYRTQLANADYVVINKIDLISEEKLETLTNLFKKEFAQPRIFPVSARSGEGLPEWFDCLMTQQHKEKQQTEVNQPLLDEGHASLGWLNCTVNLSSVKYWDGSAVLMELAASIQNNLRAERCELGHLKMSLRPNQEIGGIATIHLVRNDAVPEISRKLPEPLQSGELILNLRAEADPELLHTIFNRALLSLVDKHPQLFARLEHCEHFRPARAA